MQSETAGCQWDGTSSRGIQFVTLAVYAFREGAWFPPDANEPDGEMVNGVGDDAYRKEIGLSGTAGDLVVRYGGLIINITVFNDQRKYKDLHPQQVELANLLISRRRRSAPIRTGPARSRALDTRYREPVNRRSRTARVGSVLAAVGLLVTPRGAGRRRGARPATVPDRPLRSTTSPGSCGRRRSPRPRRWSRRSEARTQARDRDRALAERLQYSISPQEALADGRTIMDTWGVGRKGVNDGLIVLFDLDASLQTDVEARPGDARHGLPASRTCT